MTFFHNIIVCQKSWKGNVGDEDSLQCNDLSLSIFNTVETNPQDYSVSFSKGFNRALAM